MGRHKMWLLALTLISVLSVHAFDITNEYVDEDADAVVIEAFREDEGSARSGRQFSFGTGQFAGQFAGQFPASTMPLAPVAQAANILCRTPSGSLAWCQSSYQWPWGGGIGQQYPPGVGGGWGGQYPGMGVGQNPGWPQQPQQPQQPVGGGQYPGWPPVQQPAPTHPPTPAVQAPTQAPTQAPQQPAGGGGGGSG